MTRPSAMTSAAAALVTVALSVAGCGGDDDEQEATTTPPPAAEAPGGGAAPGGLGALPPAFIQCMADQGYEVESSADIHSAPPEVLQTCFGALHGDGGAP